MRLSAASSRASAVISWFGWRARVALMVVVLSDMNSSTRYSAKALSLDEVVEEEEDFFELMNKLSALVGIGRYV